MRGDVRGGFCLNCQLPLEAGALAFRMDATHIETRRKVADGWVCNRCFHALCIMGGMSYDERQAKAAELGVRVGGGN